MSGRRIDKLPEVLIPLPRVTRLRSVFVATRSSDTIWHPPDFDVDLEAGERIASVETIPPNSAIGAGVRVWIETAPLAI